MLAPIKNLSIRRFKSIRDQVIHDLSKHEKIATFVTELVETLQGVLKERDG